MGMLFLVGWNVNFYHGPWTKMVPRYALRGLGELPSDNCQILQTLNDYPAVQERASGRASPPATATSIPPRKIKPASVLKPPEPSLEAVGADPLTGSSVGPPFPWRPEFTPVPSEWSSLSPCASPGLSGRRESAGTSYCQLCRSR